MKLTAKQIKMVQDALENNGSCECSSYSGRGMYGKTCASVSGSYRECMGAVNEIIQDLVQELVDACHDSIRPDDLHDDVNAIIEVLITGMQQDSLGMGVVLYWKDIPGRQEV